METPILSVSGVSKHFGGLMVFNDISFNVQTGEALGLMGPNGAGKLTLLNIISGDDKPDSGTIRFKGHDITALAPHRICHLGIARTYQIPQKGITILFVEQNVRRSLLEADQAYIMEAGHVVLSGNAAALQEEERVKKAYSGD